MKDEIRDAFSQNEKELISRREALKKGGKYAALTSATMFVVLSPKAKAEDTQSSPDEPDAW